MVKKIVFDKDMLLFRAVMNTVVLEKFDASSVLPEADSFAEKIYQEYLAAGSPKDQTGWLKAHLKDSYLYVETPPRWVGDSPEWLYFNDEPMVFIFQYELPENDVTRKCLTWDRVIYAFGARLPYLKGYKMEYRLVTQAKTELT